MGSSSSASSQYLSMFDEVIAERMAEGGGIGLAATLGSALGAEGEGGAQLVTTSLQQGSSFVGASGGNLAGGVSAPLPTLQGATARLAQAAYGISARDGG